MNAQHLMDAPDATKSGAAPAIQIRASVLKDTKVGTPSSDAVKVKGVVIWVAVADAVQAEVCLYNRLLKDEHPDAGGKDFLVTLNPDSLNVITAYVEPSLGTGGATDAQTDDKFLFERHGYFVADRKRHTAGNAVFNKSNELKNTWSEK